MNPKVLVQCFFCVLIFLSAADAEAKSVRSLHDAELYENVARTVDSVRVVVKFLDDSGVRADGRQYRYSPELSDPSWFDRYGIPHKDLIDGLKMTNAIIAEYGLAADRLIDDREEKMAEIRAAAEGYWGSEIAELATYSQLVLKGEERIDTRALVNRLNRISIVEVAYVEPIALPPIGPEKSLQEQDYSCANLPTPPGLVNLSSHQGYAGKPPAGINASAIQSISGSKGNNIRVIDIEGGMAPHFELPQLLMQTGSTYKDFAGHGTSVLAVIAGKNDGKGINGIVPSAKVGIRSIFTQQYANWTEANQDSFNVSKNIYWASKHSIKGVVLIELQRSGPKEDNCECGQCTNLPVEYWPAEFDTIKTAVGNGVTIVEAAGNGGRSLDHPMLGANFDRQFRDSGAILTTAARATA